MSIPQPNSYFAPSGLGLYAGRFRPQAGNYEHLLDELNFTVENVGVAVAMPDQLMQLDNSGGEREEIGWCTEWQAKYLAIRNDSGVPQQEKDDLRAYIIKQADDLLIYDWWDISANGQTINGTSVPSDSSHRPAIWWLPILLTNDEQQRQAFLYNMRGMVWMEQRYRQRTSSDTSVPNILYPIPLQEREFAWYLRDIAWLAYFEEKGILTNSLLSGTEFRTNLANIRTHLQDQMTKPDMNTLGILGTEIWRDMDGRTDRNLITWVSTHWMQGYCASVVGCILKMGFTTGWSDIAAWHMNFFNNTCGGNWPMRDADGDHINMDALIKNTFDALPEQDKATYDIYANIPLADLANAGSRWRNDESPYLRADALVNYNGGAGWPTDLVVDKYIEGQTMTFAERMDIKLTGLAMYADAGVPGAANLVGQLKYQRRLRLERGGMPGGGDFYRFASSWYEYPEVTGTVQATWGVYTDSTFINPDDSSQWVPSYAFVPPVSNNCTGTDPGGSPRSIVGAWSGAAWDEVNNRMIINGGGHADYHGNDTYAVVFNSDDTITVQVWWYPTQDFTGFNCDGDDQTALRVMADGSRPSVHSYGGLAYIGNDTVFLYGGSLASNAGIKDFSRWTIQWNGLEGDSNWNNLVIDGRTGPALGVHLAYHPSVDIMYALEGMILYTVNKITGARTVVNGAISSVGTADSYGISYDYTRGKIVAIGQYDFQNIPGSPAMRVYDCATGSRTSTLNTIPLDVDGPGGDYCPDLDRHVFWGGGNTLYLVHPETFAFETLTIDDSAIGGAIPSKTMTGMFGRFRYSTTQKRFVIVSNFGGPMHYIQLTGV